MKFSLRPDTLAFQLSRPGVALRSMVNIPVPAIAKQIKAFRYAEDMNEFVGGPALGKPLGDPEQDAVHFYMLNHAVAVIRQRVHVYEPLGDYLPIVQQYHKWLAVLSIRMFHYMLLICTRESRHCHNLDSSLFTTLASKYGQGCLKFNHSISSQGSDGAANALITSPPDVTVGNYTAYLADNFNQGHYSGGFGGKAWGKVAEVLRDFVHGKLSAEMMMDTAFTLCHNNGPIFNKGMLFGGFTQRIYKILDVQRSGQIPQFVAESGASAFGPLVSTLYVQCRDVLGESFGGYVDWFIVEELGALKSYKAEQAAQVGKYGQPEKYKAKMEAGALKKAIAVAQAEKEAKMQVTIHPGCVVQKLEVVR